MGPKWVSNFTKAAPSPASERTSFQPNSNPQIRAHGPRPQTFIIFVQVYYLATSRLGVWSSPDRQTEGKTYIDSSKHPNDEGRIHGWSASGPVILLLCSLLARNWGSIYGPMNLRMKVPWPPKFMAHFFRTDLACPMGQGDSCTSPPLHLGRIHPDVPAIPVVAPPASSPAGPHCGPAPLSAAHACSAYISPAPPR